ncbi:MAG: zinc transporter ZntB [Pseudomonadota bacterium]
MINPDDMIIYGCSIEGDGSGQILSDQALLDRLKADDLAWVHLNLDHPDTRGWLEENISYLDPIIIDALMAEETRPRALEIDDGMFLSLRGVNLNDNADPEDMISIRMWIDAHRIISVRRRKLRAVQDMREYLLAGKGPKNAGDVLSFVTSKLFERMEPVFTDLDDRLDSLEERIMEQPDAKDRKAITEIRKEAIMFRRYIAPQKDVMAQLRTTDISWVENTHKRKMQESMDRIIRYVEDIDAIRERAQITKDELANALADTLNKNMYVLSVIAAIFLPLGFLTGLLGINVGGIPGADNADAFLIFCTILIMLVLLQIALFKKMKWF